MLDAILRRFIERTLSSYEAELELERGPTETFQALLRASRYGSMAQSTARRS